MAYLYQCRICKSVWVELIFDTYKICKFCKSTKTRAIAELNTGEKIYD